MLSRIARMYRDPVTAFATFNVRLQATLSMDDILDHDIVRRSGYDKSDVKSLLLREKVFTTGSSSGKNGSELDYTNFKKFFFPKLMMI